MDEHARKVPAGIYDDIVFHGDRLIRFTEIPAIPWLPKPIRPYRKTTAYHWIKRQTGALEYVPGPPKATTERALMRFFGIDTP